MSKVHPELAHTCGVVPTGIVGLDELMMDGLRPGELGVVIGSADGHEVQLIDRFVGTAYSEGLKVVYCVLDSGLVGTCERLMPQLSCNRDDGNWRNSTPRDEARVIIADRTDDSKGECLIEPLKAGQATVLQLVQLLYGMDTSWGWTADLVVIDCADRFAARLSGAETRDVLTGTYEDLRMLADRFAVPVWTTSRVSAAQDGDGSRQPHLEFADFLVAFDHSDGQLRLLNQNLSGQRRRYSEPIRVPLAQNDRNVA